MDRTPRASARTSRWRASSTTFGPVGRLGWTAAVATGLTWGFFHLFVVGWLCLLAIGVVILRDVWRPARIVPAHPEIGSPDPTPAAVRPDGERPPAVVLIRPWAAAGVAALVIFLVGGETTKVAVIMITTLVGTFAFFRGFVR